jgi:hypothetical protein
MKSHPLKPSRIKINGEQHDALILVVRSRDSRGRAKLCEIIYDDETVVVGGDEDYSIIYASERALRTKN